MLPPNVCANLSLFTLSINEEDQVIWTASLHGKFSIGFAYDIVNGTPTAAACWNKLWKLVTLPRIKTFLWLLGHDRLLTKENCLKSGLVKSTICPKCSSSVESVLHML